MRDMKQGKLQSITVMVYHGAAGIQLPGRG